MWNEYNVVCERTDGLVPSILVVTVYGQQAEGWRAGCRSPHLQPAIECSGRSDERSYISQ